MIGDVPKGAPLRCRMGKHSGQQEGGLMAFYCPRCEGTYWQTGDYRAQLAVADSMIDRGDFDGAQALVARTLGRDA